MSFPVIPKTIRGAYVFVAVYFLSLSFNLCGQGQATRQMDVAPAGVTFRPTEVKRQKLTKTDVQITLQAHSAIPELDVMVAGITNALHASEIPSGSYQESMKGLQNGQRNQLTKAITSAEGYSGEIAITTRAVKPGSEVAEFKTVLPYETKNGQLKLETTKSGRSGPVGVTAKPTKYTIADGYVVKGEVGVSLKGVSKLKDEGLSVTVNAEGITLLDRQQSANTSQDFHQSITFAAADGERGRITTQVSGKTESGKDYVRRSYLYVLGDPNQLYTSTSGFIDLDIQKLKADRAANRIDEGQYAARMTAILSGATEQSGVKP
jgi:hypothetical protein